MFLPQKFRILEKHELGRGFFVLNRYRVQHERFDGAWSRPYDRELFERGDSACILLWDPDRDAVVLVEQFRLGAKKHPLGPWLLELVAGMVEPGEQPAEVVCREAREEAGVEVTGVLEIGSYLASPGGTDERVWLFLGLVDAELAGGVHGLPEENEEIRVRVLPRTELMQTAWQGRTDNAPLLLALSWLSLNESRLRANGFDGLRAPE
jgi:ADP-ribose pyrophosphatase